MHGNKIVLDLEFTPVRDPDLQAVASSEILEIGAVKLNENNEVMEEFQTYVKPQYSSIPPHITRITGITEKTVENAPSYGAAVAAFTDWVGDSVRSRFYTWSNSDQGVLLKEADLKEQTLHKMFYTYWVDLQRIHQRLYGFTRPMNLTSARGRCRSISRGRSMVRWQMPETPPESCSSSAMYRRCGSRSRHRTLHTTAQSPMDSLWGWFSRTAERKKAETPDVVSLP